MSIVKQSLVGASGQGGGYTINDSLRFRSSASAYLSRTPASAGNRRTWTWSGWVKRGLLGTDQLIFGSTPSGASGDSNYFFIAWTTENKISVGGYTAALRRTNAVYRDPSAWYHIVLMLDTTQATASNRVKLYVNGEEGTSFQYFVNPSLNQELGVNQAAIHAISSRQTFSSTYYLDGYITEVNFIDGQALTADDFGQYDANGTWKAKEYTGTYGTNGFYIDATTSGSTVLDQSGNSNNWTANNMNLTTSTATTYDLMKDTPSLVDENAANFATLNPLDNNGVALSEANLTAVMATNENVSATIAPTSGKWYWEVYIVDSTNPYIGVKKTESNITGYSGDAVGINTAGDIYFNGSNQGKDGLPNFSNGDVVGVGLDVDAQKIWWSKNGQWYTADAATESPIASSVVVAGNNGYSYGSQITNVKPYVGSSTTTGSVTVNFGQRPFAYTPPTGFKKLNTFNLPNSTIEDGSDYFNTVLWTGNNTYPRSITGVGFQPDLLWTKNRSNAYDHLLMDVLRGTGNLKWLSSSQTNAEGSYYGNANVTSLDSDGFTIGSTSGTNVLNNSTSIVAWNWKANGSGVSNTDGDTPSTVSPNTTAGFSIVTYTGSGYLGTNLPTTVGHGLGVAPKFIFLKSRTTTEPWLTYHGSLGGTQYLFLNQTSQANSNIAFFNNTDPTSTVFSLGNSAAGNTNNANYVAYCFNSVEGYSAFGKYTGNGSSDGPFIYTGFRPAFVLLKITSAVENWVIFDDARNEYNLSQLALYPHSSGAEVTISTNGIDMLSNGFKLRGTGTRTNGSGQSYIYMAFAENPFKNALAR